MPFLHTTCHTIQFSHFHATLTVSEALLLWHLFIERKFEDTEELLKYLPDKLVIVEKCSILDYVQAFFHPINK